jgi:hypothetical protein
VLRAIAERLISDGQFAEVENDNMEVNDGLNQEQDVLADKVMDTVGVEESQPEAEAEGLEDSDAGHSRESLSVQKRLKAQKRAHERQTRGLEARLAELESRLSQNQNPLHEQHSMPSHGDGIEDHIHKAVSYALQHKEMEERKAHEAQNAAHVQRQYQEFQKHLDNVGDKYDDFHDVVFGADTPYTSAMRDYAVTLPRSGAGSAAEVLYKLGKNPEELRRISKLHPLDQASEMSRLSHALISGGEPKSSSSNAPLGQIKSNPVVNSRSVTDKTPVSNIRQRMKTGSWK